MPSSGGRRIRLGADFLQAETNSVEFNYYRNVVKTAPGEWELLICSLILCMKKLC